MPLLDDSHTPVFFDVFYRPFDGNGQTLLAQVREEYFSSLHGKSGKLRSVETGAECRTRYKIGHGVFQWRKTSGKLILQQSYRDRDGYSILTWNPAGELISKARFGANHHWLQTCYYAGDPARPAAMLKPEQSGGLFLLRYCEKTQRYEKTMLRPLPYTAGSAEQSLVNAVVGEPEVIARTDGGSFCYCPAQEAARRAAVLNDLKSGERSIKPVWPEEPDAKLHFIYIENAVPKPEPGPQEVPFSVPETAKSVWIPEAVQKKDYHANHELYSVEASAPKKYAVAARGIGGKTQVSSAVAPGVQRAATRIVVSAEESYLYFGKVINGLRQGRGRTQMSNGNTAYEGNYVDGKRDGFGVYYYKSGKLCYAGNWKENLRDGTGVAFSSRDGSIFVGRWKNNIPTGPGAAFDADGNLIYTGEWKDGKRHGHGTEFRNGEIVFSGEFRDDHYYSGYKRIEDETAVSESDEQDKEESAVRSDVKQ